MALLAQCEAERVHPALTDEVNPSPGTVAWLGEDGPCAGSLRSPLCGTGTWGEAVGQFVPGPWELSRNCM